MAEGLLNLSRDERRVVIELAAGELGLPAVVVEKDAWICWTLDVLFSGVSPLPMAFKGGTSLSKAFGAIRRFSEDLDITIGFPEMSAELPLSRAGCKALVAFLRERTAEFVLEVIAPALRSRLGAECESGTVSVRDRETLVLHYPTCLDISPGYVSCEVVLEFGGRNRVVPAERHVLTSLVSVLDLPVICPTATVEVLSPARTFWEKVTLVHAECQRMSWRSGVDRLARHWYDLAVLADHEIGHRALVERSILEDVVRVKESLWRRAGSGYELCLKGKCQLVPCEEMVTELEHDYVAMQRAGMFFGSSPSFASLMTRIEQLEREINASFL